MIKRFLIIGLAAGSLLGQFMVPYAPPPDTYSLTELNSLFAPDVTMTIMRDGNHGMIDQSAPPSKKYPKGLHTRTYFELPEGRSYMVDLQDPTAPCKTGSSKLTWADPFDLSAQLHKQLDPRIRRDRVGDDINGIPSHLVIMPQLNAWLELKHGLILKLQRHEKEGTRTVIEVQKLSFAKPPAGAVSLPATCR